MRVAGVFVHEKNSWKTFEQIFTVAYHHVTSSIKHKKDTATKGCVEPSQISVMELLYEQQLTVSSPGLFLLFFTFTKVSS